jgi:hypothetical protein
VKNSFLIQIPNVFKLKRATYHIMVDEGTSFVGSSGFIKIHEGGRVIKLLHSFHLRVNLLRARSVFASTRFCS